MQKFQKPKISKLKNSKPPKCALDNFPIDPLQSKISKIQTLKKSQNSKIPKIQNSKIPNFTNPTCPIAYTHVCMAVETCTTPVHPPIPMFDLSAPLPPPARIVPNKSLEYRVWSNTSGEASTHKKIPAERYLERNTTKIYCWHTLRGVYKTSTTPIDGQKSLSCGCRTRYVG